MKTVKNSFFAIVSMLLVAVAVNPAVSFAAEKGAEQELGKSLSLEIGRASCRERV